jgi:subtilisin family serine protease
MMINDEFRLMHGTSMATPFISGLIALLLEEDPSLDPPAIKNILRNASVIPNTAPGTHDLKWGYGLIDASNL